MENHRTYLYRRIVEAKLFMDENYANAIPTKIIAGVACFSEFHFLRLFKEVYLDGYKQNAEKEL
jgi:AraC-like DNA-binding protein